MMETKGKSGQLTPYLSPLGAWAFALGTAIGWGSMIVTSNTYLVQAGPLGSVLGLMVGAIVMVVMAKNYHYLMNRYPDSGGAYTYAKKVFGYDHAFMTAWFLALTYLAMFWANDTSLPLFARYFMGDAFQFGFHYTVFGYEVYLGEVVLCFAGVVIVALLCTHFRMLVAKLMIALAVLFTAGIAISFIAIALGSGAGFAVADPMILPDESAVSQVFLIACISPWAFVGFESISQQAGEFSFSHTKSFRIMAAAIVTATILYVLLLLISTTAYPSQYGNWFEYVSDLGNLSGIEALPVFYVAFCYMGNAGVALLMLVLLALVVTSLIANIVALSRLFHAMAQDSILPKRFGVVNKHAIPGAAVLLAAGASLVIPFLGRTAIG